MHKLWGVYRNDGVSWKLRAVGYEGDLQESSIGALLWLSQQRSLKGDSAGTVQGSERKAPDKDLLNGLVGLRDVLADCRDNLW